MKDNVICDPCREKICRDSQDNHTSIKVRNLFSVVRNIETNIELLKSHLSDPIIKDILDLP